MLLSSIGRFETEVSTFAHPTTRKRPILSASSERLKITPHRDCFKQSDETKEPTLSKKVQKSEEEWRAQLTPEQYRIMREAGTERAFTGEYWETKTPGVYRCSGCGEKLFSSDTKFDSGSGWPSFYAPEEEDKIVSRPDNSLGRQRTEVLCGTCDSHLGHVFPDGPQPTGQRFCINSASLKLEPKG